MSAEVPITVEAAREAALDVWPAEIIERSDVDEAIEAAIRAADEARGLRMEWSIPGSPRPVTNDIATVAAILEERPGLEVMERIYGPWKPVKEDSK